MPLEPEKPHLRLGYVALTDSAPLLVAEAKGFFAAEGLEVTLSQEPSWANICDKVCYGALDGAHMLAAMPLALTLGLGPLRRDMVVALSLSLNGNAVTLSNALIRELASADPVTAQQRPLPAAALRAAIERRARDGVPPLTLAHVFEFSNHNYQLRDWLAAGGIDPERDVRLRVIPPVQMLNSVAEGSIDGFCVGEPWNTLAVRAGYGKIAITGYDIWNNAPEKVFGVTREWAEAHPQTHLAVLRALLQAAQWLADPVNREECNELLRRSLLIQSPLVLLGDSPPTPEFQRLAANFPWRSRAMWLLVQMLRWGQITRPLAMRAVIEQVYQPGRYREAAASLRLSVPYDDWKREGEHDSAWELAGSAGPIAMGPDRLLDGTRFDPTQPLAYLQKVAIAHPRIDLAALVALEAKFSAP
jgi:nitrate/nitrite transport system substrate-binding protein